MHKRESHNFASNERGNYMSNKFNNIHQFLGLLEAVQPSGAGFMARCPAHDDQHPSLSISEGDGARMDLLPCRM